jgi:fucose 4-O-acetylase-like acetyltransferase
MALFVYAVLNPSRHQGYLQQLGKTCSMFVYILHPAVWHTMEKVYQMTNVDHNMMARYLMPIIVLALTVLLSIACYRVQQKLSCSKTNA